jgi:uncharacterized protein YcbK (DUF882 family)
MWKPAHVGKSLMSKLQVRTPILGRRHFLTGVSASLFVPRPAFAIGASGVRQLAFDNLHTGEKVKVEYWAEGQYLQDALAQINHVLRDFRSGEVHPIAPQLLDLISMLQARLETTGPVSIISGYRSPATNVMLRGEREHSGVATKSLHMQGMAIDLRIAGRSLAAVRTAALAQRLGGVGYYPQSDFVHVDVGRVRSW